MSTPSDAPATSTGTVARVTLLLSVLAETTGDASLGDIAARMKLPASTTHRLLNLLQEQGFVERGRGNRTYRAGLEFVRVGGLVSSRAEITELAQGFMKAVVDSCGETCMLSLYMPASQSSMIASVIYGPHPLRYEAAKYQPSSLAWGATGRGILAFLPPEEIDRVLARQEASPGTGRKMGSPAAILRDLAQIRAQGYAHSRGQKVPGAVGLSAPVFNAGGVIGALCITLPDSRFGEQMLPRFTRTLTEQAARLSSMLGAPAR